MPSEANKREYGVETAAPTSLNLKPSAALQRERERSPRIHRRAPRAYIFTPELVVRLIEHIKKL